jgi:Mn2+/Fe2+ NRAMP family transporter
LEGKLLLFVIALIGTTVAPWQLFFHQSNVVDKRVTARWLGYARTDTLIGTLLFTLGAVAILGACAVAFSGTAAEGRFVDAGHTAGSLSEHLGGWAGTLFAVALLNGSVMGAGAVTLATSYAIGDVFGVKHSLHRRWRDAPVFHGSFAGMIALAAAAVLVPGLPLGLTNVGVHVLAGVLLPSATLFLLLLCNDTAVLGPHVNPWWLNAVSAVVVGGLIALSGLLTVTTLFPSLLGATETAVVGVTTAAAVALVVSAMSGPERRPRFTGGRWDRLTWTTPPLDTLAPPVASRARTLGLVILRAYLALAMVLAGAKIVGLMAGG